MGRRDRLIVLIDNYDSFSYNLVQYLRMLDEEVLVFRNDQISVQEIESLKPEWILLSPGPCTPNETGICLGLIQEYHRRIPMLGVCLGHQTLAAAFGGRVIPAQVPVHGKVMPVIHQGGGVFHGLPNPLQVTRYHSLIVDKETLPSVFEVTAVSPTGEIMGMRHKEVLLEGLQFHPEAYLTQDGIRLLQHFQKEVKAWRKSHGESR